MVSSTVDHMISVTVFLAATLLFIGLFNQTIQTAVIYQRHRATATKASDLLDSMLLSPGIPVNWGQTDSNLTGFGLQAPEFTQYKISPYSLMRLRSSVGEPVYYNATGQYYSNVTMGDRNFMLVPYNLALDYSTVTRLMGINNSYGVQLTLTPIVTVSIQETSGSPLTLRVTAAGVGFPLSYATVSYCFLKVGSQGNEPYYDISFGTVTADDTGSSLHDKLMILGAEALMSALPAIAEQETSEQVLNRVKQNETDACYASKLNKAEAKINWSLSAEEIQRAVRAYNSWPVAYCCYEKNNKPSSLRLWQAEAITKNNSTVDLLPGQVLAESAKGIDVVTGEGVLRITQLQPEGKRKMKAADFLNANSLLNQILK